MAQIYFANQGESLELVVDNLQHTLSSMESRIEAIKNLNPHIGNKSIVYKNNVPILLTESNDNEAVCSANFDQFRHQYAQLKPTNINAIESFGADEAFTLLEVIAQFKNDYLPDYDQNSLLADGNTFGGGALAAYSGRVSGLIQEMKKIEILLKEYSLASGANKHKLKPQIRLAYERLHQKFGPVIQKYIQRARAGSKLGTVYSSRNAMKAAVRGRITPLTTGNNSRMILNTAKGLRVLSKGAFVLDLGFRVRNVVQSSNRVRTSVSELLGMSASFVVGLIGTGLGIALSLGPLGWVLLIVGTGMLALSADYIGKILGNYVYDYVY